MKAFVITGILCLICKMNVLAQTLYLKGSSPSDVYGYTDYWDIVVRNDSIQMFCSFKKDSLDIRANNRQYFGVLHSDSNYLKANTIILYKSLYVDDCNKPRLQYLNTDTLTMYIDSALIKQCHFALEFKTPNKPTKSFQLTDPFYTFPIKKNLIYTLKFEADSSTNYRAITVKTKQKCAVMMGDNLPSYAFYLKQEGEVFELKKAYPYNAGSCSVVVKSIKLKSSH